MRYAQLPDPAAVAYLDVRPGELGEASHGTPATWDLAGRCFSPSVTQIVSLAVLVPSWWGDTMTISLLLLSADAGDTAWVYSNNAASQQIVTMPGSYGGRFVPVWTDVPIYSTSPAGAAAPGWSFANLSFQRQSDDEGDPPEQNPDDTCTSPVVVLGVRLSPGQ